MMQNLQVKFSMMNEQDHYEMKTKKKKITNRM